MAFDLSKIDITSLVPEAEGESPLRATMSEAVKVNPDSQVKIKKLSRDSGLPQSVVEGDPQYIETSLNLEKIDFETLSKRNPNTSKYLVDFNNATLAHDDIDSLSSLERALTPVASAAKAALSLEEGVLRTPQFVEDSLALASKNLEDITGLPSMFNPIRGLETIASGYRMALDPLTSSFKQTREVLPQIAEPFRRVGVMDEKGQKALDSAIQGDFDQLFDVLTDPEAVASYTANAVPSLFAAIATGGGLPAIMTMEAGGELVEQADFEGEISLENRVQAVAQTALISGMLEKVGVDYFRRFPVFQKFFKDADARGVNVADVFKTALAEGGTEVLQELNQNVAAKITYNPEKSLTEGLLQAFVGGAGSGASVSTVAYAADKIDATMLNENRTEVKSNAEQTIIDSVTKDAEASKLKQRDKESFREFMQTATDGDVDVFLDGEQITNYLSTKTPEEVQADPVLTLLSTKINESETTDVDVSIPVADFATDVVGSDHYEALRPHMKLSADSSTPFRQEQEQEEARSYVTKLMADAQESASEYVEAQEIFTEVRDQLIDTGRMTEQQASVMAQVVPAWATVQAKNRGISVAQVYQESGLTIKGPETGRASRLKEMGAKVLRQFGIGGQPVIAKEAQEAPQLARGSSKEEIISTYESLLPTHAEGGLDYAVAPDELQELVDTAGDGYLYRVTLPEFIEQGSDPARYEHQYKDGSVRPSISYTTSMKDALAYVRVRADSVDARPAEDYVVYRVRPEDTQQSSDFRLLVPVDKQPGDLTLHVHAAADVPLGASEVVAQGAELAKQVDTMYNELEGETYAIDEYTEEDLKSTFESLGVEYIEAGAETEGLGFDFGAAEEGAEGRGGLPEADLTAVRFFQTAETPSTLVNTRSPAFRKWSDGGEVVEPEDVNDYQFAENTPVVLKVFHGTTHKFSVFDAKRGNLEGQFGAINYFTSSEYDAIENYAGEGPDLTNRIEQRAEQLSYKIDHQFEEKGRKEVLESLHRSTGVLGFISAHISDMDDSDAAHHAARLLAKHELSGGEEQVMELFVKVENPFVIGGEAPWIEFVDRESIDEQAIMRVAEEHEIDPSEVEENRDDYEDEIDEARWEIEEEEPNKLTEAIEAVSDRYGIDASNLFASIMDLGDEAKPESIEEMLRSSEDYAYAEGEEGGLIGNQLIAEVIEEMGFDSIILRNAEQRFKSMNMGVDTAHVHIFDSNKTNIKSVRNFGEFDPTNPDIYMQRGTRGYYSPEESMIRLTKSSDLSTFLHEFAHFMYDMELRNQGSELTPQIHDWFKRNAEAVAKEANDIDMNTTILSKHVVAYLDEGTAGDKQRDLAIEQAVHEQFARGFETYLMEGKAPSIEMRNVFRTISRWLVQVYKSIKGELQVNLDDEMRQVFDRLLATEEQIAAASARARYEPMFTDAAMAGMTEEEFTAYRNRSTASENKAVETLRDKMIKQITRQTKAWWKTEKQDLIDEETEKLSGQQVYAARNALRTGQMKLDRAVVREMVGEERTDKLGRTTNRIPDELRGMTAPSVDGVHPEEAAAFFGYGSGDQMLKDLITAPNIKEVAEANAQQRMIDVHGDILNDGTIEQEADAAVQNEERGEIILTELRSLARQANRASIERGTLKTLAEEQIGKLSFRDIHPAKYRKAEIKAAQEAAAMMATGDVEGAMAAKTRQAMNFYLGKAATDAKNDVMKIVDRVARYRKKSVREAIMKAGNGYWEQLTKVLDRFEFRKSATMKKVDEVNESLNTWVKARIEEDGDGLVLSSAVLDERYQTHWKNVPYSELVGIDDSLKNIEHVARYSNKMNALEEEIEFNQLVQTWVDSMNEKVKTRFKSQRTSVAEGRNWGRWAMAQMTKMPWLASWLDGGERAGISHDILVNPFRDAYDEELNLWKEVGTPVMDAIQNRSKEDMKRHNRKIYIPEIKDADNDGNLMGHQVLAVALNTGNAGNLKKMLLGEGWANPDNEEEITIDNPKLQAVLKHMTRSDWGLVQLIWDQMDKLYPQLSEVHQRTTGLTPPKVEATPVETPFGTIRGGYYPVKYDPHRSFRAEQNEDRLAAETESMFGQVGLQASVNASATNERTGYYAPIRLSLDVVPNHFQETIHYITHHDAVRQTNKLIRNEQVAKTIKEKLGEEEYAQLKPWLNDIAKDGRETPMRTFWGSILQKLRFGTTLGVMGFKASTGIIQTSGLFNTVAETGKGPVIQALRTIVGSPDTMRKAWGFAAENSKVMKHRAKTMDREIKSAMQKLEGKRGFLAATQEASMKHIAYIQAYMVDLPSWHAGYIKGMKEWGDEKRAYEYADWVVESVQGSGNTFNMAQIMRNQSQEARLFTMFMTFFSSLWNMERDLVKGARSGVYSKSSVAAKLMFIFTLPVLFEMLLKGDLGEDEDDEELQKVMTNLALYPVQSVPFIRDIASGVIGDYGYNISPIAQLIEGGTRSIPELVTRPFTDEEITKGQVKGATKFIGAAAGVPGVSQAWATGEHLYGVMTEGEELTARELIYGPKKE